eukprot:4932106-Amphidinium_carterae.1
MAKKPVTRGLADKTLELELGEVRKPHPVPFDFDGTIFVCLPSQAREREEEVGSEPCDCGPGGP